MITSQELQFVRLAMRQRLLSVNVVQEAVERKKWDAPDQPISQILVDMGALKPDTAQKLRKQLDEPPRETKLRATQIGKDPNAREDPELGGVPSRIGPYQLVRLLGAGAMGAVYHARHVELERDVALKLLQSEGAPTARAIARFKREARLAARLDHPNIVRVWEAGNENNQHFIAMDMVRGKSVAELLTLGEITVRRAVHILRKTAEATAYAHEQGVIHRDLKPANILVDEKTGEPRVTDFGLATLSEPDADDKLTRTGAAVGTPAYMAPEQVRGHLDEIDRRTDVYALGATLYEMLTGAPPFDAPTFLELAKKICDEDPAAPRKKNAAVPAPIETVCLKALEKDPAQRYQTAADMAVDLAAFLDDAPIRAQPPTPLERVRRWARRRPALVAGGLGFMAVLGAALGFWVSQPGTIEITTEPAGAVVVVDEAEVLDEHGNPARTPVTLRVPAGEHDLRFKLDGYIDRALGVDVVRVGHAETLKVSGSLISSSGLLRVVSTPPDAPVTVLGADGAERARGATPFLASFPAGKYRVVAGAPGGHLTPKDAAREVELTPGGEKVLRFEAERDLAELRIDADPENVSVRWARDDSSRVAPTVLPGSGAHEVEVSKAGYLPQRLTIQVPPGGRVDRRVTLVPLASWRRALEGRLLAPPLVRDVDGDGAPDLLVLEEDRDGARFTLLPGGGHTRAAFRVSTSARALIDAEDLDGDGVLEVLLGGDQHLELRDGRSGRLVSRLAQVDGAGAVVHRAPGQAPQVVLLDDGDRPRLVPMSLAGGAPGRPSTHAGARPALVPRGVRLGAFSPRATAVFPVQGGILVWNVDGSDAPRRLPLAGVGPTSTVIGVAVDRQGDPWVAIVPEEGEAWIVDPQAFRRFQVGEPTARLRRPGFLLTDRPWLLLTDDARARTRAFVLAEAGAREADGAMSPGAVVLRHGAEPGGAGPALWTSAGDVYAPAGDRWERVDLCSTDAEAWASRDAEPTVADADADGVAEVLLPSPDRRAVVALDPTPGRVRWRARERVPEAFALAALDSTPGEDLLYSSGDRLVGRAADDGRVVLNHDVKGRILAFAAEAAVRPQDGPRALYTVSIPEGAADDPAARTVIRWKHDGAWRPAWTKTRPALGIDALPFDADTDGATDVLCGGPLSVLRAKDGDEVWSQRFGGQPRGMGSAGARFLPGAIPLCVGPRDPSREGGVPALVAHDPLGKLVWEAALAVRRPGADGADATEVPDPPRLVLGDESDPTLVVLTATRVMGLLRTDGTIAWSFDLDGVVGAVFTPGKLVLSRTSGELRALDANKGTLLWARRLPPGERQGATPSPPAWLPAPARPTLPDRGGERDAEPIVAVVAPSGVLLLLALEDGAVLGERRSTGAGFLPWLAALPGGAGGAFVAATDDGRLVAVPAGAQHRGRDDRRKSVREQMRRVEMGGDHARAALVVLQDLARENDAGSGARLALARAHLALGEYPQALEAARSVTGIGLRVPEALRVQAESTFALRRSMQEVDPFLDELVAADPALAAQVAVDLAGRSGVDASRFLRKVRDFAPFDPAVRRLLGLERLRSIGLAPGRLWNAAQREELDEVRRTASEARAELLVSLTRQDDPEARAGAIVALVLERRATLVFSVKRPSRTESDRLTLLSTLLGGLASAEPGARVVELACQLALAPEDGGDLAALAPMIAELTALRPQWEGVLQGIGSLRP